MKDIEDVKQWANDRLRLEIGKAMGKEGLYLSFEFLPNYCTDVAAARRAQAKAIELDAERYVKILADVVGVFQWDECEGNLHPEVVAWLLSATPRQISEAAYITIQEAQK